MRTGNVITYQQVTGVTINTSGSGYSFAFVSFTGGGGSGATGSINLGDAKIEMFLT